MKIPNNFNPLGIDDAFNLSKGLLFNAPLQDDFNATGGTITDYHNWTIQSDYQGKKCALPGINTSNGIFCNLDNPILGTVPFTISVEFYGLVHGNNQGLFYIGKSVVKQVFGYQVVYNTNPPIWSTAWGDGYTYSNNLTYTAGQWTVFTATYDTQTIRIYNDGQLFSVLTSPNPLTLNIQKSTSGFSGNYGDLAIGSRWGDGARYWHGALRNFYIYDYALNDDQVNMFYNATKNL